jgi:hypothetical protein
MPLRHYGPGNPESFEDDEVLAEGLDLIQEDHGSLPCQLTLSSLSLPVAIIPAILPSTLKVW